MGWPYLHSDIPHNLENLRHHLRRAAHVGNQTDDGPGVGGGGERILGRIGGGVRWGVTIFCWPCTFRVSHQGWATDFCPHARRHARGRIRGNPSRKYRSAREKVADNKVRKVLKVSRESIRCLAYLLGRSVRLDKYVEIRGVRRFL